MRLLLSFLTVFLFTSNCLAQAKDKQESTYLKVKSGDDITTYEFHSIEDFEENSEKILDEITSANPPGKKEKEAVLTIEISITVTYDKESTTISGSVTAPSSTVINEAKKLRTQLIAIALG